MTTMYNYQVVIRNKVNVNKDATRSGNSDAQRLPLNKPGNDSNTPLNMTNNNRNWEVMALESTTARDGCLQNEWLNHKLYGILGYGIRTNMALDMVLMDFGFTIMVTPQQVEI